MVCSFFFVRAAFQFLGRVDSGARGSRTRRALCPYNSGVFLVHFGVRWCASAVCHVKLNVLLKLVGGRLVESPRNCAKNRRASSKNFVKNPYLNGFYRVF